MDQKASFKSRIDEDFTDLDRGWVAAYLQGSADLFDRVWADGFVFTFPFGEFANKEQELANIKADQLVFESLSTDDINVRVYGNTALMAGHFTMKGRNKDRNISGQYSYRHVLEKQRERWRIVASHAAHIA